MSTKHTDQAVLLDLHRRGVIPETCLAEALTRLDHAWNRAARAGDDRRKAIAEGRYPSRAEQEELNDLARGS